MSLAKKVRLNASNGGSWHQCKKESTEEGEGLKSASSRKLKRCDLTETISLVETLLKGCNEHNQDIVSSFMLFKIICHRPSAGGTMTYTSFLMKRKVTPGSSAEAGGITDFI